MTPQHNDTVRWFWDWYLKWKYWRAFSAIHFDLSAAAGQLDPGLPVVLVPNHISWWDGFFCFEVQQKLRYGSGIYSLMLESELKKFPILRQVGCFGLDPSNPISIRRAFIQFRDVVSADPYRTLTFFPQGKIVPVCSRPLGFLRGIETLSKIVGRLQYVPIGIHIEPMNLEKPTAFICAGRPLDSFHTQVDHKYLEVEVSKLLDRVSISKPQALLKGGA